MTTYTAMLKDLDALKGSDAWHDIARRAGLHYDTIARIARGAIADPGISTVESIAAAISERQDELDKPRRRK